MKILDYLQLIRFHNIFIACLSVLLSAHLIDIYNWHQIMICMFLIIFSMSFANSMNDILDFQADKINHPKRVMSKGLISFNKAKTISCLSLLISIVFSFFLNSIDIKIFFYIILLTLIAYNFFLKKIAFIGNIIIASLLASIFIFIELALTTQVNILTIPALLAFGLSLIRESIKDLHDFSGDRFSGMKTLPIIFGIKTSCSLISALIFLSCILFTFPYFYGLYGLKYFISLIIFIEIPLLYSLFLLLNFQTIKTFKQLINLYKTLSVFGLFVIFLTKQ